MSKQKYPQAASTTASGAPAKKGREHYSHAKANAKSKVRRQEAAERDAIYAGLSIQARIVKAKSRRGESKRELARLEKLLMVQKAPAVKQTPLTPEQKSAKAVKRAKDSANAVSAHKQ